MSRADLLALGPQALAQLSNMGLVKRAQRELEEGLVPTLVENDDGTVIGTFPDGVVAKLPPSTPLKESPCSCGATSVCRHRIAVALAYAPWHATNAKAGPHVDTDCAESLASPPREASHWSPGEVDDDTLFRALGERIVERAKRTRKRGVVVTVERGDVPVAKLPSCTVQFLVPRDVAYARCDCVDAGGACEHLALAVWAFREADTVAPAGARTVVSLGSNATTSTGCMAVLDDALALARSILIRGVETFQPAKTRFAQLKTRLEHEKVVWVHGIVSDLEIALEGYHARSALHGTREIAALLVELRARTRAGLAEASELPSRFVLGQGESSETHLDHVRLVSLGARLRADERTRYADVFLADPDTATVLVLQKRWSYDEKAEPEDGQLLGSRRITPQISLRALAHGQLVSKVVRRLANRSVELGTSRSAQSSVTPQTGDHSTLPAPLLVRDLSEHAARSELAPPPILRPRVLAENVHVVEISAVLDIGYSAAEQRLSARLTDAAGNDFLLVLRHRRVAPCAIDATIVALEAIPRFVSGSLVHTSHGFELTPLSLSVQGLVVPDLALPTKAFPPASQAFAGNASPFEDALLRAESVLEELCSVGLENASRALLDRMGTAREKLDDTGLSALARRLEALEGHTRARRTDEAATAWLDASLRIVLTRDALLE